MDKSVIKMLPQKIKVIIHKNAEKEIRHDPCKIVAYVDYQQIHKIDILDKKFSIDGQRAGHLP